MRSARVRGHVPTFSAYPMGVWFIPLAGIAAWAAFFLGMAGMGWLWDNLPRLSLEFSAWFGSL